MPPRHSRTLARRSLGLTLEAAAAQIGVGTKTLERFELTPTRTFKKLQHRLQARVIYGDLALGPAPNSEGAKSIKPCGSCGQPTTNAQSFKSHPRAGLAGIPGLRFCSYKCRKAYAPPPKAKGKRERTRTLKPETVIIQEIVKLNARNSK